MICAVSDVGLSRPYMIVFLCVIASSIATWRSVLICGPITNSPWNTLTDEGVLNFQTFYYAGVRPSI